MKKKIQYRRLKIWLDSYAMYKAQAVFFSDKKTHNLIKEKMDSICESIVKEVLEHKKDYINF